MDDVPAPAPDGWRAMALDDPFLARIGPMFIADPFAATANEPARFGLRVLPHHRNFAGTGHGGLIATVLDIALGQGVATLLDGLYAPTVALSIDYLRAAQSDDWLETRLRLLSRTRSMVFCDGVLSGREGPVARASAVFKIIARRDTDAASPPG